MHTEACEKWSLHVMTLGSECVRHAWTLVFARHWHVIMAYEVVCT